jgi:hypothetical protein
MVQNSPLGMLYCVMHFSSGPVLGRIARVVTFEHSFSFKSPTLSLSLGQFPGGGRRRGELGFPDEPKLIREVGIIHD